MRCCNLVGGTPCGLGVPLAYECYKLVGNTPFGLRVGSGSGGPFCV